MRVLITGGAGYIGTTLTNFLLAAGHSVRCYDRLMFGGDVLIPFFRHPQFEFVLGDIRDREALRKSLQGVDAIVHLAAIVGYPACKKDPVLAEETNLEGTRILNLVRSKQQPVIYGSTGSTYGALSDGICTEETPVNPLTVYGRTKADAEQALLDAGNVVAYRFATAFGISPRLRLDLLVNDFCYQALRNRSLVIYEAHFKRTFIHVFDIARAIGHALENVETMRDNVFNCGDNRMNASKMDIAELVREHVDFYLHAADVGKDEDQRNYEVSYAKIHKTGFSTSISLQDGIAELLRALQVISIRNPYSNV